MGKSDRGAAYVCVRSVLVESELYADKDDSFLCDFVGTLFALGLAEAERGP